MIGDPDGDCRERSCDEIRNTVPLRHHQSQRAGPESLNQAMGQRRDFRHQPLNSLRIRHMDDERIEERAPLGFSIFTGR